MIAKRWLGQAQNSLLKTLEEPPEYIVIILITNNENAFLNTIRSRCTKIFFEDLNSEEIKKILKNEYNISVKENILLNTRGSIEKVIKLNDKEDEYINLEENFNKIDKINLLDFLKIKDNILNDKENIPEKIEYLINILYKKIKDNIKNENNKEIKEETINNNLQNIEKNIKIRYINCIEILEKSRQRLEKNSNIEMTIDYMLMKMWEEING